MKPNCFSWFINKSYTSRHKQLNIFPLKIKASWVYKKDKFKRELRMDLFTLSFSNVITFLTWQIWLCIVHALRKRWCIKLISVSFMLYKKISKFLWPILDLSVIRDPNHTGCFFIHHLCTYQHYYSHTRQWNQGWRGDVGVTYWPNIIHPKYHFSPVHRYIKLLTHKIIHEIDVEVTIHWREMLLDENWSLP